LLNAIPREVLLFGKSDFRFALKAISTGRRSISVPLRETNCAALELQGTAERRLSSGIVGSPLCRVHLHKSDGES
jgi:hypothetical protein